MSIQLDKKAYEKLVNEDIKVLEEHMPIYSLEKKHIIEVLKWSIKEIYK